MSHFMYGQNGHGSRITGSPMITMMDGSDSMTSNMSSNMNSMNNMNMGMSDNSFNINENMRVSTVVGFIKIITLGWEPVSIIY